MVKPQSSFGKIKKCSVQYYLYEEKRNPIDDALRNYSILISQIFSNLCQIYCLLEARIKSKHEYLENKTIPSVHFDIPLISESFVNKQLIDSP